MKAESDHGEADRALHGGRRPGRPIRGIRKFALSMLLIVVVVGTGVALAAWFTMTRPETPRREVVARAPLVEVRTLVPKDTREVFVGYGSARADREVELSAEVGGRIVEIAEGLKDGSAVVAGQVLVQIDDREYRQRLARAEGQLADVVAQIEKLQVEEANAKRLVALAGEEVEVTRNEYQRLTDLYEKQAASKKEWDFARLAYQRSRRELRVLQNAVDLIKPQRGKLSSLQDAREADKQLALLEVERCTITAPMAGRVEEIAVEVGDLVRPGGAILRLIDPRRIEVPIELPASVYAKTEVGARCVLSMDTMPGIRWETTVRRVSPAADEQSRTFTAYVEVDNAAEAIALVPGYFVAAKVMGPVIPRALVIPRGAIVDDRVFVVNDDRAHARAVRIGVLIGDQVVVSVGLAAGDRVILTNLDVVHEGALVRTSEPTSAAAEREAAGRGEGDR